MDQTLDSRNLANERVRPFITSGPPGNEAIIKPSWGILPQPGRFVLPNSDVVCSVSVKEAWPRPQSSAYMGFINSTTNTYMFVMC
ncbi:hypothetical protein Tsubulata_026949 [Turnera subulata]|uniref:Uncharacterized protein n=1 Tax=Turnera subulata TaxID=218843 RepID=A0A9Q0F3A4_9ROSI|nr:hypothetical protein Tsubulata_026949 [Turnera subulata]